MRVDHRRTALCGFLLNLLFVGVASATLIQEDFSGSSLDTNVWGVAFTGGAVAPSQAGGQLLTRVVDVGQNQRALIYSVATDFDFTVQPLTLSADIASLGGTGSVTRPVNRYLMIGSSGTNTEVLSRYYPGTEILYGVWLSAGQTNGVNYLEVGSVRMGVVTANREIYTGELGSMSLALNGTNYSVFASGTGGFSVGSGSGFSGTLANVRVVDYNDHFRFAMGSANSYQGVVSAGAVASWDSVSVVPEPGTLGLFVLMGGLVIGWRTRHTHRVVAAR